MDMGSINMTHPHYGTSLIRISIFNVVGMILKTVLKALLILVSNDCCYLLIFSSNYVMQSIQDSLSVVSLSDIM